MKSNITTDILNEKNLKYITSSVDGLIKQVESFTKKDLLNSKRLYQQQEKDDLINNYFQITAKSVNRNIQSSIVTPMESEFGMAKITKPEVEQPEEEETEEGINIPPVIPPGGEIIEEGGKPDGSNGKLLNSQLKSIGDGQRLWIPAADAYLAMKNAAQKDGIYFRVTEGYRTYETQLAYEKNPPMGPGTAAKAGTSLHGWGKAIDISSPGAQEWIRKNGKQYGWIWPSWAQKSPYEPWHFEYVGGRESRAEATKEKRNIEKLASPSKNKSNNIAVINYDNNQNQYPVTPTKSNSVASLNRNTAEKSQVLFGHTTFNVG
jgi:hypothetical protein